LNEAALPRLPILTSVNDKLAQEHNSLKSTTRSRAQLAQEHIVHRMTEAAGEPKPSDLVTVIEGFDAMHALLAAVWQRRSSAAEDLASIVGGSTWADGSPADQALWQDWLTAVRNCRRP
jgi:hypothetical protein